MRAPNLTMLNRTGRKTAVALVMLLSLLATGGVIATAQAEDPEQEVVDIASFTAKLLYNDVWLFQGYVSGGPTVAGLNVTFGGLLDGQSATTDSGGGFYLVYDLNGQYGTASAVATSIDNIDSSTAYVGAG